MKHRAQLLAIVGLLTVGSISIPQMASSTENQLELVGIGSLSQHQIHGGTERERAKVRYSIFLLARQDLLMPQLDIYVHDAYDECMGHGGVFNQDGSGLRVDLCDDQLELTWHELAHAWEYHNMDDATRQAFLERTGLPTWDDQGFAHGIRAIEQAAWAISFGVSPHRLTQQEADAHREILDQYELLVGKPSPRIAHLADPDPTGSGSTVRSGGGGLLHLAE